MTELDAAFVLGMIHATIETETKEIKNPFDMDQQPKEWGKYMDGKTYIWTLPETS